MEKLQQKTHRLKTVICMVVLLSASIFVLKPLAQPGFFLSDDGEWMIIRLTAFFQSLRDGQFPVRFLGRLNHNYGYPVANFLYPGFLYVGSFFHGLGISFVDSVKLILAGSLTGAGIFVFFWLRTFFSRIPSLLGALAFLSAPYVLFDLYHRGSVGEIFALLPAAIALFAFSRRALWLLAPAVGLLLVAHNTLALIFMIYMLLLWCLSPDRSRLISIVIGCGLASFFWIPALFERSYVIFDSVPISQPVSYLATGKQLVLAAPVFMLGFVGLFLRKKKSSFSVMSGILFGIGIFLTLPAARAVWQDLPGVSLIQFPYRLQAVTSVIGAYLIAALLEGQRARFIGVFSVVAAIFWISSILQVKNNLSWVEREGGYYSTNEATTTVADEYMPRWVGQKPHERAAEKLLIADGLGLVQVTKETTQTVVATVSLQTVSLLQINTIYYPGWGVLVDGLPVAVQKKEGSGVMQFLVPEGRHTISAEFHETPLRLAADAITIGSLLAWVGFFLRSRRRKRL